METPRAYAMFERAQRHLERMKKAVQQPGTDFEDSLTSFLNAFYSAIDLHPKETIYGTRYEKWRASLSEEDRVLWEDLKRDLKEQRSKDTHHVKGMDLPTQGESLPLQDVRSFIPPEVFELTGIRPEQVDFAGMGGYMFTRERLVETQNKCEQGLRLLECLIREFPAS